MTKNILFLVCLFCATQVVNAQLTGVGYDATIQHITARIALSPNNLDLGLRLRYVDDVPDDNKLLVSVSGFFLMPLKELGPITLFGAAGGVLTKLPQKDDNLSVIPFVGVQPEIIVLEKLALSIRFGLDVPIIPDFRIETIGSGISVTTAANFKILF